MAKVKFFGVMRLDIGIAELDIDADNIHTLLKIIADTTDKFTIDDLKNSIIFVDGVNIMDIKKYKTKLNNSSEVLFLSPVGGG